MPKLPVIEGFEGQNLEVTHNSWSGGVLYANGKIVKKDRQSGEMLLTRNDGSQAIVKFKMQALGFDFPQLDIDGVNISIVQPLKWYAWVWVSLPLVLVLFGGLPAVVFAVFGFLANTKIIRSEQKEIVKYAITGLVTAAALLLYYVITLFAPGLNEWGF